MFGPIIFRARLLVCSGAFVLACAAAAAFAQGTPGTHASIANYVSPIIGPTNDTVTVWYGNRVALVVDPQSSLPSPNQATMTQIVNTLDNFYTAYDTVTGQTPLAGNYELNGKIRVEFTTNMPSGVAGTASGNSGHYGIAVGNGFFTDAGELYSRVNQGINTYDQVLFYESERDYWGGAFNARIDYATSTNPNSWGWWTVGFNNAMSIFMSKPGVISGVSDMYYYGENGQQFSDGMLANLTTYENNPLLYNWNNSWNVDRVPWNTSVSVNDLMTGLLIDMYNKYGGLQFISNLYREIPKSDPLLGWPQDRQGAIDNFYMAASRAAGVDLYSYFANTLRWPISAGLNPFAVDPQTVWNGSASGLWDNAANWNGGAVPNASNQIVAFSGSNNLAVDLHGNRTVKMLTFDDLAAAGFTVSNSVPGAALTIAASGGIAKLSNDLVTSNQTVATPIILAGDATFANQNAWSQNANQLIINGTISGSHVLHIAGQQTADGGGGVRLNADNSSTFTGTIELDCGMLLVGANNALGSPTAAKTIVNAGNLWFDAGVNCTANLIVAGSSTQSNLGASSFSGNIQVNNGVTWTITNGGGNGFTISGVLSGPGSVTMTYGGTTLTGTASNTLSGLVDFNTTSANFDTLTLNKSSGATAIAGNLELDNVAVAILGQNNQIADSSIVTLNGPSTQLRLMGNSDTIGGLQGGSSGAGVVQDDHSSRASTLTISPSAGASYTFSGSIQNGSTAALSLSKTGAGVQTLSGTNTYSGGTTINQGTLQFAGTAALYDGSSGSWVPAKITVAAGATLGIGLGSAAAGYFDAGALATLLNSSHLGASTAITGLKTGAILGLDTTNAAGGTFTYSGSIANAGGSGGTGVAKLGAGKLILSGTNTYTGGTSVIADTLIVASPAAIENGTSLTVGAGAASLFAPAASPPVESAVAAVPEPCTAALFAVGALAALGCKWRRRGHVVG